MELTRIKTECPYCNAVMRPVVAACDRCDVEIRGHFRTTQFSHLPSEDLEFLERYLLAGFSIKTLAEGSGLGYVAIRNRLDRIIKSYRCHLEDEEEKFAILKKLENGEMTSEEAAKAIERL
ncbi:DUF2089 family protein [uncultured Gimesia sp.]|uniref:DUF2089 family protein n=1 Tax=uncultured Gimesia sp. TaxID=1678688 RepID=UPI0030DC91FD|tara:strand:+ start:29871 stop:30233 length:363 start_codon:yes stop_codon:yes gene_type:complete